MRRAPDRTQWLLIMLGGFFMAGCRHLGPQTVTRDRTDYSTAVAESWKEQTLLNIVKLRYLDLPLFLDVGQIVAGYSIEASGNLGGQVSSANAVQGNSLFLGASGKFTDRPTITYAPLTGDRFLRGLMEPIPPQSIFYLIQSGYAADFVLALSVDAMNGLRNQHISVGSQRAADPEFLRAAELLRKIQLSGGIGMRIEKTTNNTPAMVIFFHSERLSQEIETEIAELKGLLDFPTNTDRVKLIYSPVREEKGELAVQTRSMAQILFMMASFVEVPNQQIAEHRALPSQNVPMAQWPIKVRCTSNKPAGAYATVFYRGNWFWIEDTDLLSKRAFGFIMFLFSLADTGTNAGMPVLTIPAQ